MASEGDSIPQLVESITQGSPSANCSVPVAGGDTSSNAQTTIPCQKDLVLDEEIKKDLFTDTFCKVCSANLPFESNRISHYEGKKHAQKVRLYFQTPNEQEEIPVKKQKIDRADFHVDGVRAMDRNQFCSLCNMVFSSPVVAQSHYVGKVHGKKLRQLLGEPSQWAPQTDHVTSIVLAQLTSRPEKAVPPVAVTHPSLPLAEKPNQQEMITEQLPSTDDESELNDPDKHCRLCSAFFNKPLMAQQHYNGKKHARNEARKKMMEGMEEPSAGYGQFVCPVCSVTLQSIEMYQSHMQGNKHQVKESMLANLMKTSKKSYDSFQDELADYIKVQKARGLEPKTYFRQEKDYNDSCEYEEEEFEGRPPPEHMKTMTRVPYEYFDNSISYPAYNPSQPAGNRVSPWSSHWENVCRSQNPEKGQYFDIKNTQHIVHTPSSQDSSDDCKGLSSGESSGSHRKDRKHKRKHRKENKQKGAKFRREDESAERKKKDTDSGRDDDRQEGEKGKKVETESAAGDKSKHRKERKKKEQQPVEKETKKPKKDKKEGDKRTEEEILWDESILGF
ncbi:lysine-rich coiled-coil protein 1 [Ascaphus truei]|uniref:lysine-rich coiled-coil protein 1 n=1 Tax=Ascaphus truei TaxID=8439 RepID=UPI003F5AB144